MRKFIVLFFSIICFNLWAQDLYPYLENDMYGYMDVQGEIVIPAQYESVTDFCNFKWIESETYKLSEEVIKAYFKDKPKFNVIQIKGLAQVKIDGKWTFIDSTGRVLFPASSENRIVVGRFPMGSYKSNANKIDLLRITDTTTSNWGLIHTKNLVSQGLIYKQSNEGRFLNHENYNQKYVVANRLDGNYDLLDGKTGAFILSGKKLIQKIYNNFYSCIEQNGDWYVYDAIKASAHQLDHSSKNIVSNKNDFLSIKDCPFLIVGKPGRLGMIDLNGNLVVEKKFNKIIKRGNEFIANDNIILSIDYPDLEQGACITKTTSNALKHRLCNLYSGKVQVLQASGMPLSKAYDMIQLETRSNIYQFRDGHESGLMDMFGLEFIRYESDAISPLYNFDCESSSRAPKGGRNCFSGYYMVCKDDLCGLIDKNGDEIYPINYKSFSLKKNDQLLSIIGADDKKGIGDLAGKLLIPAIYDNIQSYNYVGKISYTCTIGDRSDKYDYKFNLVNPNKKSVEKLIAQRMENGKYMLQDSAGINIVNTEFDALNGYKITGKRNTLVMAGYQDKNQSIQIFNAEGKKIYDEKIEDYNKNEKLVSIAELEGIIVDKNNKQGVLHISGEYIIEPNKYAYLIRSKNFIAGFLNKDHYLPFDLFDLNAEPFFDGRIQDILVVTGSYIVQSNGKFGVISLVGDTLEPFEYDDAFGFKFKKNSEQTLVRYKDQLVGYPLAIYEDENETRRHWRRFSTPSVVSQIEQKVSQYGKYSGCYYLLKKDKNANKVYLKYFNKLLYEGQHDSITEIDFLDESLLAYNGKDSTRISYKAAPQKEYGTKLGNGLFYKDDGEFRTFINKNGKELLKTPVEIKSLYTFLGDGKGALWGSKAFIVVNQDGEIIANLECDTDIEAIPGSRYYSHHFLLLEHNFVKLFLNGKPYLYNFENNVSFKK